MINQILYVQPFTIEADGLDETNIRRALFWPVFLDSFLKHRISLLHSDLLYLPVEFHKGDISIKSYSEKGKFYSEMDRIVSKLDLIVDSNTVICISVMTAYHVLATNLIAGYFKNRYPTVIVIIGGVQCTVVPSDFIYNRAPIDYIIKGEGELNLYKLINSELKIQDSPKVITNECISNLNDLPLLDYSIMDKYISFFEIIGINLSRGCPFNCNFCIEKEIRISNQKIKSWRSYSPKRAAEEAENLFKYGISNNIENFTFPDPIFGFKKSWFTDFLNLTQFNDSISSIWIETRVDALNTKIVKELKKKKFYLLYGLESYSEKMLLLMNKTHEPKSYLNKFENIFEIHSELDYPCSIFVLPGYPGETINTLSTTFKKLNELLSSSHSDVLNILLRYYHHFPGTYVYNNIQKFTKDHGTVVNFPVWWNDEKLFKYGACCVQPSKDFTIRESYLAFYQGYKDMIGLKYDDATKEHKLLIKYANFNMDKRKEAFFNFLDKNNLH